MIVPLPSQVERSALRVKVKYLKDLVVSGGFMESKLDAPPPLPLSKKQLALMDLNTQKEENISLVQDGLADLKRAITEVVECWNIL